MLLVRREVQLSRHSPLAFRFPSTITYLARTTSGVGPTDGMTDWYGTRRWTRFEMRWTKWKPARIRSLHPEGSLDGV